MKASLTSCEANTDEQHVQFYIQCNLIPSKIFTFFFKNTLLRVKKEKNINRSKKDTKR